jgi:hypothetical protein
MHTPLDRAQLIEDACARLDAHWMPALVACWRAITRTPGGAALRPAELVRVAQATLDLSSGLIRERAAIGQDYMSDPDRLAAYLLYFWPVSYAQCRVFAAQAMHATGLPLGRALDLGSGPGPMTVAALDLGATSIDAVEQSQLALTALHHLVAASQASDRVFGRRANLQETPDALPVGPFDTILLGHTLNELWADDPDPVARRLDWIERELLPRLTADGTLLLIEPALRETSRAALAIRDALLARGWSVAAPCLFAGACPALTRPQDWCHAEHPWRPPALTAELAYAAGLRKETLKMTPLAMRPPGAQPALAFTAPSEAPRLFHIVSERLDIKGKLRVVGCGPEGRHMLTLMNKHVRPTNAAFEELVRGDVAALSHTVEKGDGLALDPDTIVRPLVADWTVVKL